MAIISFFTLAILGAVAFVVFCNLHAEELVTPDYYEREVRYQGHIDKLTRTREVREQLRLTYHRERQELEIVLPGQVFSDASTAQVEFYRPSASRLDRVIKLDANRGANQSIPVRDLTPGLWRVRVSWSHAGQDYWAEEKLVVKG